MPFLNVPWQEVFVPTHSVLEMFLRGTIMYLVIFLLLRFVLKRQTGGLSTPDILLVVLLADAAQNGMADEYKSVTEGIIVICTIIFWNFAIDWLEFHFPAMERVLRPAPLLLIHNGQVLRRHLRQELVTMDELMSRLREEGVTDPHEVRWAFMEPDGTITVKKKTSS
jgi:uncharacterized membrane protein YcaP (DUF421 family)